MIFRRPSARFVYNYQFLQSQSSMSPRECNDQYRIISNRLFPHMPFTRENSIELITDTCNTVFTSSLPVENFIVNAYKNIEGGVIAEK